MKEGAQVRPTFQRIVNRRAPVIPSASIKSDTCDADRRRDPAPKSSKLRSSQFYSECWGFGAPVRTKLRAPLCYWNCDAILVPCESLETGINSGPLGPFRV